jgi:hypothetical protein
MKNLFFLSLLVGLIGLLVVIGAKASDNAAVTATVTVQNVTVSLNHASFDYGIIANNTASSTLPLWSGAGIIATNDGNVSEDFDINGADTVDWAIKTTAGGDEYVHKFCNDTDDVCTSPPTSYSALTTSPTPLKTSIGTSGTCVFQLQITTPNPDTHYTQQSAAVTITASAS